MKKLILTTLAVTLTLSATAEAVKLTPATKLAVEASSKNKISAHKIYSAIARSSQERKIINADSAFTNLTTRSSLKAQVEVSTKTAIHNLEKSYIKFDLRSLSTEKRDKIENLLNTKLKASSLTGTEGVRFMRSLDDNSVEVASIHLASTKDRKYLIGISEIVNEADSIALGTAIQKTKVKVRTNK